MKNRIDVERGRYWDRAWSLIDGCTPCSPGCDNCWSASMTHRFNFQYTDCVGKFNGKITTRPDKLLIPLKRKKPTVYAIWNDLFHADVRTTFIDDVFEVIAACPRHTFLILTKRAHLMESKIYGNETTEYFIRVLGGGDYFPNVWHGLTICNQQEADEKIPIFLQVPGKKFLSIEPMLGRIDIGKWLPQMVYNPGKTIPERETFMVIDAVICGSETGPGARPVNLDWIRSLRAQCFMAGVPFFLKHISKKGGRILDGRTHDDLPWVVKQI